MKNWKTSAVFFVSFFSAYFANVAINLACGGEIDPYDYYISFFHNNLQGDRNYKSFYFTEFQFLYDEAEPANEKQINADEWAAYLGENVKSADVEKAMYWLDSTGNEAVNNWLLNGKNRVPDSLAHNSFLNALASGHQSALQYYQFAKQVEPVANFTYKLWEPTPVDTTALRIAAKKALSFAGAEQDPFIRLRYYYQAQRLFHFGLAYQQAKDIYDGFINLNPSKSHVKGWAMALKAGEERKLGDTVKAAFLFSKVFADWPERRNQAYQNYYYNRVSAEQVLPLAKTNDDKAVIYAINGFGKPEIGMENLQKVYQYQPQSPMVGVLLVREVNKLEAYYLTARLKNVTDSAAKTSRKAMIYASKGAGSRKKFFGWLIFGESVLLLIGLTWIIARKRPVKTVWKLSSVFLLSTAAMLLIDAAIIHQQASAQSKSIHNNTEFFTAVPDSIQIKYNNYIQRLSAFCDRLSAENKYPVAGIDHLTEAYLWWMQGKTADGFKAIEASNKEKLNPKLQDQRQIVKLLLLAQNIQKLDRISELELLPSLKWLDNKVKSTQTQVINNSAWHEANINRFATTSRDFYLHILAPAYLRQNDTTLAALALLKSESFDAGQNDYFYQQNKMLPDFWYKYLSSSRLQQLLGWKENQSKNPWIKFLTVRLAGVKTDVLYELLGTAFLREHKYAAAATAFAHQKNAGKRSMDEELGDPFLAQLNDYPKTFALKGKRFTKIDFARAMAYLQKQIQAEPANPQLYYRFATGLYNTSTYGNSSNLISYDWSSTDFARKAVYTYDTDYVQAINAERYYLKARAVSNNADFKAKCTFMAAKCRQKRQEMPNYVFNYDAYEAAQKNYRRQLRQNPYFKELIKYKQTSFYKTAIEECSYLKDFILTR